MTMDTIYLDNNSTTPILPQVADVMRRAHAAVYANPASQHRAGQTAKTALENARDGMAAILGARTSSSQSDRVVLCSGGTEANNLALRGLAGRKPGHLVISAIEHPSITGTAEHLETLGWKVDRLGVDGNGVVHVNELPSLLTDRTCLVSVMLGNNETGVLQPVAELARICSAAGVPLHTDAAQVVGKLEVHFRDLGIDALSFTAHKFHGPRGIGALIVRHGVPLEPVLFGGFQQSGLRPGTESVVLAIGAERALAIWQADHDSHAQRLASLRDRFEQRLRDGFPDLVVNGQYAERLPHTSSISFPGLDRQTLLMALDMTGVACSTGSACASGSSEPSGVLLAMGCDEALVKGSLRFSLGRLNTTAEVDEAVVRILRVCSDLRREETPQKMA